MFGSNQWMAVGGVAVPFVIATVALFTGRAQFTEWAEFCRWAVPIGIGVSQAVSGAIKIFAKPPEQP
jgi:hypothetical protein